MNGFEIEPGIIISKLDLKDGDTLVIVIDPDIWDIETAQQMMDCSQRIFPNNNIICTLKGFDIVVKKSL